MYKGPYINLRDAVQQGGIEGLKASKGMRAEKALMTQRTTGKLREVTEDFNEKLSKEILTRFQTANDDVRVAEEDIKKYLKGLPAETTTESNTGLMSKSTGGTDIVEFIAEQEQFRATPYWDEKQYTNGYGTKAKSKDEVITEEEARKRLSEQVEVARSAVKRLEKKYDEPFTEGQTKALISFTYNTGQGNLMKLADQGNRGISEIGDMLTEYVYAGKKKLPGLVKRRKLEYQIFNEGN